MSQRLCDARRAFPTEVNSSMQFLHTVDSLFLAFRVAVGTRGTIVSSDDGGFNWKPQALPADTSEVDLSGVFVLDDGGAVAVGGDCNGK
jgi:photosystem II stability/assembly factor-like uncharacterized protein